MDDIVRLKEAMQHTLARNKKKTEKTKKYNNYWQVLPSNIDRIGEILLFSVGYKGLPVSDVGTVTTL